MGWSWKAVWDTGISELGLSQLMVKRGEVDEFEGD